MKTLFALGFSLVSLTAFAHSGRGERWVYRVPQVSGAEGARLTRWIVSQGYDVAGVHWATRSMELVFETPEQKVRFEQATRWTPTGRRGGGPDAALDPRYLGSAALVERFQAMARSYPAFARLEEIGKSLENRPILALEIARQGQRRQPQAPLPVILVDGVHHAREVMTSEISLYFAEETLKAAAAGDAATLALLGQVRFVVVPMVNPDGAERVRADQPMWRKNARVINGAVTGVDLNRNYAYQWGACGGSSPSPSSDTYRGPTAASEPETVAMTRLGDRLKPIGNLSFHSYGELVLYPYGCQGKFTPEDALVARVAKNLAKSLPSDSGGQRTYEAGTTWQMLYPLDGGAKDYQYAANGTISFTVEVNQDFQPPYSIRNATVEKHRRGILGFAQDLAKNLTKIQVVDDATGIPTVARVEFASIPHLGGERPFETDALGRFTKVLDPGDYLIRVTTPGGKRAELAFRMTGVSAPLTLRVR